MSELLEKTKTSMKRSPFIQCLPLPEFESRDLAAVLKMFQPFPRCVLGQSWLKKPETDFAPGHVRIAWRENKLLVFAELTDADIFSSTTAHNQPAWEMGDAFEMFFQPMDEPSYIELEVTPNNHRLQLRFDSAKALAALRQTQVIDPVVIRREIFTSQTWIKLEKSAWYIYAELDTAALGCGGNTLAGRQMRFSFGRYDYTRGRKPPVISSTSAHSEPDFHRVEEWGMVSFETD